MWLMGQICEQNSACWQRAWLGGAKEGPKGRRQTLHRAESSSLVNIEG